MPSRGGGLSTTCRQGIIPLRTQAQDGLVLDERFRLRQATADEMANKLARQTALAKKSFSIRAPRRASVFFGCKRASRGPKMRHGLASQRKLGLSMPPASGRSRNMKIKTFHLAAALV